MAIIIETSEPRALNKKIFDLISNRYVRTWLVDEEGDYTSANSLWQEKAWLRARIEETRIVFCIISSKRYLMTKELYGVYHGRFAAMLLAYFDNEMQRLILTPKAYSNYDIV